VSVPSATLCIGATMTASPGTGGTWISSAPGVATIDNAGLITGISAGTVTFTFTETLTGCSAATSIVTVSTIPTVSIPSATLCIGTNLGASPGTGGTWVSSAPAVATIDNAGLITGISAGAATFTFTETATGCSATTSTVTIIALPTVSTPFATLCIGTTMSASPGAGGTWVSSAPAIATIDNTGLITAISAGTVTFTFTDTATGCSATTSSITINALPTVSTSSITLCIGSALNASPGTGGIWLSNDPAVATINNAGLITGISVGTVTFTYTETATGCSATTSTVTVNINPIVSISSTTLCVGATVTASPGTGGAWVSSDPTVATIDNTGLVTGVSAGTITLTFIETATGCSSTTSTVIVNALPTVSTPSATMCIGTTMTAIPGTGGTWVSSAPGVATIDNAGLITGISAGMVTFTFTETATGCSNTTLLVTVENIPDQSLVIGTTINPVCSGGVSNVTITNSEIGVSYQLRNDADDSNVGSAVAGTGATIQISTDILTSTTTFNVLATRGTCSVQLNNTIIVNVSGLINGSIAVTAQDNAVCEGNGSQIIVSNSELGVNYQLRNDADDSNIGIPVAGNGVAIIYATGNLTNSTTFNILASNGACSIELTTLVTVNVDINPDPLLAVAATISSLCVGGNTTITVTNSEVGVSYQFRDNADNSLIGSAVSGTGLTIGIPTGVLNASVTYNVLATGGVCLPVQLSATAAVTVSGSIDLSLPAAAESSPICSGSNTNIQISTSEVGVDYQLIDDSNNSVIGGIVAGTGGLINLPTGTLSASSLFRVLVTNGSCSAELTSTANVVVNTLPLVGLTVNPQSPSVCSGSSTFINVDNSEAGVTYQLRDDADDSIISGAVIGNGNTINLPTGILTVAKTFNVLAVNGACSVQLTITPSIAIDAAPSPVPSVVALDAQICAGKGTFIQVLNSEAGIIYQLRDNADNANVSGATFGTGGTIDLPTGPINANRTFNVLASNTLCSVQLSTVVTVTLRAINDPLCSNCSTVIVSTINPVKVTCGATVPDGAITFKIEPPDPVVNIIGVKIQINGPTTKTQTKDFVFTGLAVGNYTYTVTYGDENNPECIKTGSFIIELSREPDPITFDLSVDEYDCLVNEGSVTIENITGAIDTDFDFTIFSNGVSVTQGVISKSSTSTFKIENLLLGDYEIQLSQNQQAVNGCVGIVNSQLVDFSIAEPSGGCPVIIPNIFTPNGDGSNDFFEIRNLPASSTLSITNRWGKEVYSSSDYQNNWTAENISDGIYYYRLVADGEAITGWVEILR
jgi:gliding motility-associated-like protein